MKPSMNLTRRSREGRLAGLLRLAKASSAPLIPAKAGTQAESERDC